MRALSSIALAVALCSVAEAGDDFKWDARRPIDAKPGQRRFVEEKTSVKHEVHVKVSGRARETRDDSLDLEFRYADEVVAADAGVVTKRRVQIERWSRAQGTLPADRCLEGRVVWIDVTPSGQTAWIENEDARITNEGKKWVLDRFQASTVSGTKDESFVEAFYPPRPAKEGDEWSIAPAELSRLLMGGEAVDPKASTVKGKLTKITVTNGVRVGRLDVRASLKLESVPELRVPWKSGGVFTLNVAINLSLEPERYRFVSAAVSGALAGKAEVMGQGGFALVDVASQAKADASEGALESVKPRDPSEGRRIVAAKPAPKKEAPPPAVVEQPAPRAAATAENRSTAPQPAVTAEKPAVEKPSPAPSAERRSASDFEVIAYLAILVGYYVGSSWLISRIAHRTGQGERALLAYVPILRIYLLAKIGDRHGCWVIFALLAAVPIGVFVFLTPLAAIAWLWIWYGVADMRGVRVPLRLLLAIVLCCPLLDLAAMAYLAFKED